MTKLDDALRDLIVETHDGFSDTCAHCGGTKEFGEIHHAAECSLLAARAELVSLRSERDELLAALEQILKIAEGPEGEGHIFDEIARAAIAKAKG